MFHTDVPGSVQVGVECETTLAALKQRLRPTIRAVLMTTLGTRLGSVSWVDERHARRRDVGD